MKKLVFIFFIGTSLSFVSCGKDVCECTEAGSTISFDENDMKDAGLDDFGQYCSSLDALAKVNSQADGCSVK